MNFQNIEYFLTVAEYKNFSRAAESLFISQQSLSENIRRLEAEVGTPLLVRGKTVTLTPAGECFASGGRKILSTQDKMLREISIITNTTRCKIVLAVAPFDLPPFLPLALSEFSRKYPEYELTIAAPHSPEIPDFFFRFTEIPKNTESIPLITGDPFAVVIHRLQALQVYGNAWEEKDRQLATEQKLSAVSEFPFLLLCENKHLHPLFQRIFEDAGFTPAEAFKSEDANLLASLCSNGSGAFLGPLDYCRRKFGPLLDPKTGTLSCYPLKTPIQIDLCMTYPKGKHLNQAEKRFVEVVRSVVNPDG